MVAGEAVVAWEILHVLAIHQGSLQVVAVFLWVVLLVVQQELVSLLAADLPLHTSHSGKTPLDPLAQALERILGEIKSCVSQVHSGI